MVKKILWFVLILILFLPTIILYQVYVPIDESSTTTITINIQRGMGLKEIARLLHDEGIIRDGFAFELVTTFKKVQSEIKAGEYALSPSLNMLQILSELVNGNYLKSHITIPEGYNIYQIAELLAKKGFGNKERFIRLTQDKEFISRLGISANTLEGYLFPETYCLFKGAKEEEIIKIMVAQLRKVITPEDENQARSLGLSFHQILTLASIIEKETSDDEERRLVSAVFHNRLKANISLESDPTVIYALLPDFDGNLKRDDLFIDSPYNTYKYKGIPSGPIASPGLKAIEAALHPAPVDYLYFVAMNNGKHKFSTHRREHKEAVLKYQSMGSKPQN
ncbi:MAG: endolytic transglycosylase MltG [Nitrospirota bacterium]